MEHPRTSKTAAVRQIWESAFRRSPIGVNEDFFDLGGDAWLAAELIERINSECGANFDATILCTASTISRLAAMLEAPQPHRTVALLNSGSGYPLFMLHGIGSSVIDLVPLARRMQLGQPIYGLEAKGNDGGHDPLTSVEDMAQFFLQAIPELLPQGPYFLIGYSFGGLVAFEMARRLAAEGRQIGLLAMLDSYPDRHYLSIGQRSLLLLQAARNRLSQGKSSAQQPKVGSTDHPIGTGDRAETRNSLVLAMHRVKDAQYRALRNYRPGSYDGPVSFVRAAIPTRFPSDPIPVWSRFMRSIQVETVPGEHLDMLTTQVEPLANILRKHLP